MEVIKHSWSLLFDHLQTLQEGYLFEWLSLIIFAVFLLTLVVGGLYLIYNVIVVMFKLDKDKYVQGHRSQHVNLLSIYLAGMYTMTSWLVLHGNDTGVILMHSWVVHLIGERLIFALFFIAMFNIYVTLHLEQELRGTAFKGWS